MSTTFTSLSQFSTDSNSLHRVLMNVLKCDYMSEKILLVSLINHLQIISSYKLHLMRNWGLPLVFRSQFSWNDELSAFIKHTRQIAGK